MAVNLGHNVCEVASAFVTNIAVEMLVRTLWNKSVLNVNYLRHIHTNVYIDDRYKYIFIFHSFYFFYSAVW